MPLSVHALCEVKDVVMYLAGKEEIPDEHHLLLEVLVNALSEQLERFVGRHFEVRTATDEEYIGNGRQKLLLRNYPLVTITTVKISDVALVATDYTVLTEDGMLFRQQGWPSSALEVKDIFVTGQPSAFAVKPNIKVTYTAGYQTPASVAVVGATAVPPDLKLATMELVARRYKLRDKVGPRESFETLSTEYDWWPAHVRAAVERYAEAGLGQAL